MKRVISIVTMASISNVSWAFPGAVITQTGHQVASTKSVAVVAANTSTASLILTASPQVTTTGSRVALLMAVPSTVTLSDVSNLSESSVNTLLDYSSPRVLDITCRDLYPWLLVDQGYYYGNQDEIDAWTEGYNEWLETRGQNSLFGWHQTRGGLSCGAENQDTSPFADYYGWGGYWDNYGYYPQLEQPETSIEVRDWADFGELTSGQYAFSLRTPATADELRSWFAGQSYSLPGSLDAAIGSYIAEGYTFLVADIQVEADQTTWMPPFQVEYAYSHGVLPYSLTAAQTASTHDAVIIGLSDSISGVSALDNVSTVEIDDACLWESEGESFSQFYESVVADTLLVSESAPSVAVEEFSFNDGDCEPCTSEPLVGSQLVPLGYTLGVDSVNLSRFRMRLQKDGFSEDPEFTANSGFVQNQIEFINYVQEIGAEYPTCGEGLLTLELMCSETVDFWLEQQAPVIGALETSGAMGSGVFAFAVFARRRRRQD